MGNKKKKDGTALNKDLLRKAAEEKLIEHRHNLEDIVKERTAQLQSTNEVLEKEIIVRKKTEDMLRVALEESQLRQAEIYSLMESSRKAEEELRQLTDELKRSNDDLEQFAYVASHDLQEPLRVVAGFVRLLEKRYKDHLDEKANEFIEYTVDGVKRMQLLIKDLLAYSQVGTKGKTFSLTNCSVALERAIYNLYSAIEESGTKVTYDLLPAVMGDSSQLSRLFQNLIGNAIKFRGGQPLRIHIFAEQKGDEWGFSVKDNGMGIDPKQFDRIFVIFQRLHTREEYEGTGIGLAICKKIIERHGGRIWVESEIGKGATFYFTIPAIE